MKIEKITVIDKPKELTYNERQVLSGSIDLKDNHIIQDLGNGFIKIIPIDKTKLIKLDL